MTNKMTSKIKIRRVFAILVLIAIACLFASTFVVTEDDYSEASAFKENNLDFEVLPSENAVRLVGYGGDDSTLILKDTVVHEGREYILKSIGDGVFEGNTGLNSITIPDSVTTLGSSAFKGCTGLTDLTMPIDLDVTRDKEHPAFEGCCNITNYVFTKGSGEGLDYPTEKPSNAIPWYCTDEDISVRIGEGVKSIGDNMFEMMGHAIQSLVISDSVKNMGDNTFHGLCIRELTIPISLKSNGTCFKDTRGLTSIIFTKGDGTAVDYYTYIDKYSEPKPSDGVFFNHAIWHQCHFTVETVEFSEGIEHIGKNTLMYCFKVKEVVFPDSVKTIGEYAFRGCKSLESITIHEGITSLAKGSFSECKSLKNVVLGSGIKEISETAFGFCESLTMIEIPSGIINLEKEAFRGCSNLVELKLSEGLKKIGQDAFKNCTALNSIEMPSTLESLGKSAFEGCSSIISITIPIGLNSVADNKFPAFNGCTKINKVTLITGIGPAFDYALEEKKGKGNYYKQTPWNISESESISVVISKGVEAIGNNTFRGSNLETCVMPDTLKKIGDNAFHSCLKMESVIIPDSVETLGKNTFKKCENLYEITFPASLNLVANNKNNAFNECNNISTFTMTKGTGDAFDYANSDGSNNFRKTPWHGKTSIKSFTILDGVEYIGNSTFRECHMETIIFPKTVSVLGNSVFEDCKKLKEIKLDSVISIGKYSLKNCESLTDVTLSEGLKHLDDSAFRGCGKITKIILSDNLEYLGERAFQDCTALQDVELPASIKNIYRSTFENCTTFSNVVIPDNIKSLDKSAYKGCTAVTSLTVPVNLNTVVDNKDPAFENCTQIEEVIFTKGDGMGFDYKDNTHTPWRISNSFKSAVFNENTTSIGNNTFRDCHDLKSVSLPKTEIALGNSAFEGCGNLQKINMDKIKSIGDYSLKNCKSLKTVVLPDCLESIGKRAFQGCDNICEISFGTGLIKLDKEAFKDFKFYDSDGKTKVTVSAEVLKGCTFSGNKGKMVKQVVIQT